MFDVLCCMSHTKSTSILYIFSLYSEHMQFIHECRMRHLITKTHISYQFVFYEIPFNKERHVCVFLSSSLC